MNRQTSLNRNTIPFQNLSNTTEQLNYYCRRVLPGKMVEMLAAMQSYAAYMRDNVPVVMAITAGVDAKDPSLVHDLQVFDCIGEPLNLVECNRIYAK